MLSRGFGADTYLVVVRHEVLQKRKLNKNGRLIVVGDIHGCHTEFLELLGKCDYNPGVDKLLLLGDLVSKGPKSTEVGVMS